MDAKWYVNKSGVVQIYMDHTIPPKGVVSAHTTEHWPRSFFDSWLQPVSSPGPDKFTVIRRCHALGDVLMLAPLLNAYPNWTLLTDPQFVPYMGEACITQWPEGYYVYDLEDALEMDHSQSEFYHTPRLDLYCRALGIERPDELDWSIALQPPRTIKDPYIFFQFRGSVAWKELERPRWNSIREGLERILPVVDECPKSGPNSNSRPLSQEEFASRVAHAELVICHDSGVLWMAHCYNRPTLVLPGPTHPDKLTPYHPSIIQALYRELPCQPCGEKGAANCSRDCLKFDVKEVVNAAGDLLQQRWATYPREAVA